LAPAPEALTTHPAIFAKVAVPMTPLGTSVVAVAPMTRPGMCAKAVVPTIKRATKKGAPFSRCPLVQQGA